jgi:GNAT superfamily N-acetyltransferase
LPIIGPIVLDIHSYEVLLPFLAYPNTALARYTLGVEKILLQENNLIVSTSANFVRYLHTQAMPANPASKVALHPEISVAALILRPITQNRYVVDNIYVHKAFRRQGIATQLIQKAHQDYPNLCLDGRFSSEGIGFFGARHRTK